MSRIRLLIAAFIAVLGMGIAVSSASALTVSPTGTYSASFATGGISFVIPGAGTTSDCAATATISTDAAGNISVTGFGVPPSNACGSVSYVFLLTPAPWAGSIVLLNGVPHIWINDVRVQITSGSFTCLYTGLVLLPLTSGTTTVGGPAGTLTSVDNPVTCPARFFGTANVGGRGGTLSRAITIR